MFERLKTLECVAVGDITVIAVVESSVAKGLLCSCVVCYYYLHVDIGVGVGVDVGVEEKEATRGDATRRNVWSNALMSDTSRQNFGNTLGFV